MNLSAVIGHYQMAAPIIPYPDLSTNTHFHVLIGYTMSQCQSLNGLLMDAIVAVTRKRSFYVCDSRIVACRLQICCCIIVIPDPLTTNIDITLMMGQPTSAHLDLQINNKSMPLISY